MNISLSLQNIQDSSLQNTSISQNVSSIKANFWLENTYANVTWGALAATQATVTPNTPTGGTPATPLAPATDATKKQTPAESIQEMLQKLIAWLNIAAWVLTAMVSPVVLLIGWLMSPDWTSGDLFNLREPMYKLWVTVSNIIYFVYAILLIFIALATIFKSKNYWYQVLLPKLFLGILAVPFTWWIIQWVISLSTIITAQVLTIPHETITALQTANPNGKDWYNDRTIPKYININTILDSKKQENLDCTVENRDQNCISPQEFTQKSGGMYGPILVYAYWIFRIQDVKTIKWATAVDVASSITKIATDGLIGVIMFFVFAILTIALMVVLLVRAFKLWIYAIFSPLITFQIVLKDKWKIEWLDFPEFLRLAFLPALIWLVLSFGLIVISSVNTAFTIKWETVQPCEKLTSRPVRGDQQAKSCSTMYIMGSSNTLKQYFYNSGSETYSLSRVNFGGLELDFDGSRPIWTNPTSSDYSGFKGIFGDLIIQFIALWFLWFAFMVAMKASKAVQAAISPFEGIGSKVKDLASSSIKYMPLPVIGSINSVDRIQRKISDIRELKDAQTFEKSLAWRAQGFQAPRPEAVEAKSNMTSEVNNNHLNIDNSLGKLTVVMEKAYEGNVKKQATESWEALTNGLLSARSSDNPNKFDEKKIKEMIERLRKSGQLTEDDIKKIKINGSIDEFNKSMRDVRMQLDSDDGYAQRIVTQFEKGATT